MGKLYSKALLLACMTTGIAFAAPSYKKGDKACYPQSAKIEKPPAQAGYNIPAGVETKGWDVFITTSFIYWQALEEGLTVGLVNPTGSAFIPNTGGSIVDMNYDFTPGFKVGLGSKASNDDWNLYLEYTYLRTKNNTSSTAPSGGSIYTNWMHSQNDAFANSVSAAWHLNLNLLDLELGRPYYVGTLLTFNPFISLRAAWISQNLNATYTGSFGATTAESKNHSSSWAIGPRFGVNSNWLIGSGIRVIGNTSFSTLYTSYKVSHTEPDIVVPNSNNFFVVDADYRFLRPNAEFDLGFGWGDYFYQRRIHLDLSATYDFAIFWNQNMMAALLNASTASGTSLTDLYLQGLTINFKLDF